MQNKKEIEDGLRPPFCLFLVGSTRNIVLSPNIFILTPILLKQNTKSVK